MPGDNPASESARQRGCRLACEGILRSQFGRRPSRGAHRAVEQLRREETDEAIVPFPSTERSRRNVLRPALALAACIALLIGLSVWLFPPTNNQPILVLMPAATATIERGTEMFAARNKTKLQPGDVLRVTGTNAATITYGNEQTSVAINEQTELKILAWAKGKRFELRLGKVEAVAARQRPFRPMLLLTMQAEARVVGTRFTLTTMSNATRLDVVEGKVRFTRLSDGVQVQVNAGNYAVASSGHELAAQPLTGSILREYWTNLPGEYHYTYLTSHRDFPDHPSGRELLDKFEAPNHRGTNYGARICGYLHPPTTGDYTFWIAGSGYLFLSRDDDPENRQQLAYSYATAPSKWTDKPAQQSVPITLVAGRRYYIETLQKQGVKLEDHLAVAWEGPGQERGIIPGRFLSPFKPKTKGPK